MKRRVFAVICGFLAALALSGCSKPGIVGTWNGSAGANSSVQLALTFGKDGKFKQTISAPVDGAQKQAVMEGTYTIKDGSLEMTIQNTTVKGVSIPAVGSAKQTVQYKIDGDTLTLITPNAKSKQSLAFQRVKE